MKKNLTPGIKSDPRKLLPLHGHPAGLTAKVLAVPASIGYGQEFKIGNVRMRRDHNRIQALDSIPASWFVDLTEDVQVG